MAAALAVGMLVVTAPVAGAAGASCTVKDFTTGIRYTGSGANLQTAIDAAGSGDTLRIKGVCVGNYTIGQRLKLLGYSTATDPTPTLDGNAAGTVLTVSAGEVAVSDLLITNGAAGSNGSGGGIYNAGALRLALSTQVSHNAAAFGAGIFNANIGSLRLIDTSLVTQNTASIDGGGIYNNGVVHLNWAVRISRNSATVYGGGIYNAGGVTLNGDASVRGNHANAGGGGVYVGEEADLTMNDSSAISGNRATVGGASGGGVLSNEGTLTMNDASSISGNKAVSAGGISNYGLAVTMNGSSSVWGNTAVSNDGGGVYNTSEFIMNDSSSIRDNSAVIGGGVFSYGRFTLNGSASISGNTAAGRGGGVYNFFDSTPSTVTLNASSSITANEAGPGHHGGGIYSEAGATLVGAVDGGNVVSNVPDNIFQAP